MPSEPSISRPLTPVQAQVVLALAQGTTITAAALRDELKDLSALALATLRALLTDAQAPAAVRMRLALAILERPQFPHPSWNLPEFPGSPNEEEFRKQMAVVELDYKRLLYEAAADRAKSKLD